MRGRRDGPGGHHRANLSVTTERRDFTGADGVTLAADVAGDLTGPTLILLHGGGQTRHSWAGAMRALVKAGYAVINLDLRGHGDSGWSNTGDYSLESRGRDLIAVAAEVAGPLAVVGASMGGSTALHAVTAGLALEALVLVDIVPRAAKDGVARIVAFMGANPAGFETLEDAAAAVAAYNPNRSTPNGNEGLRKNLRLRKDGRLYWHWDPRLLEVGHDIERVSVEDCLDDLRRISPIPTLLVRGANSDVVNDEGVSHLREYIPHLEVVETAGAGHMVAGDRNDPFNTAVIEFLERHFQSRAHGRAQSASNGPDATEVADGALE